MNLAPHAVVLRGARVSLLPTIAPKNDCVGGYDELDPVSDDNTEKSPVEKEKTLASVPVPGEKQDPLLQAIRALSSQVEAYRKHYVAR